MAMAHWEMHADHADAGVIFVPFYYRANVYTLPEFWRNALIVKYVGFFHWSR